MHSPTCQTPIHSGRSELLLVEDHDHFRGLVKQALECFLPGWVILEASSVATALDELRQSPVAVLICDISLPDGVATDVVDRLPSLHRADTRVILFSNHQAAEFEPLLARQDIHGFITKERGLKELAQLVESIAARAPDPHYPPISHV